MGYDKYWRYSDVDSFYKDAIKYVDNHVDHIEEVLYDRFNKEKSDKLKKMIRDYRNYKYENGTNIKSLLRKACKIVEMDVKNWSDFSINPNSSLKDIMIRMILGKMFNFDYVCILLLSYNKNINEDFIEDSIYVTSNYFSFKDWDDEHVNAICESASLHMSPNKIESMVNLYDESMLKSDPVRIIFDINNFIGRPLSKEFNKKYEKYIKIPEAQVYSD